MDELRTDDSGAHAARLATVHDAERISGLGSWAWRPETGEWSWSDNLFRMFGLPPGDIAPPLETVITMIHPDDQAQVQEAWRASGAGDSGDRIVEYRILRTDGAARTYRLTLVEVSTAPRRILGSVQDVTLQRNLERQLTAHLAVTQALDAWKSLEEGALGLLGQLAAALDLELGAFWLPQAASMVARAIWHTPSADFERVVELTRRSSLRSGHVGRAFASRQPVISADAPAGLNDRDAAIRRAGLRGAIAVPAVSGDETLAVMEFLSSEPIAPTEQLTRALDGIGHHVGRFLGRRRGLLTAPVLTARELEVLQLAARGRTAAQIAAELYLSPATIKRHFESAYAGLDVSDRASAVGEAMRRGLIT